MMKPSLRPEIAERFACSIDILRSRMDMLLQNLRIPEDIDVVDWIESTVVIPRAVSTVGGSKIKLYGYQKALARLAVDPGTKELVVPKGTRTGLTQLCAAIDAFHVAHQGKPVGLWQPTEDKAKKFANEYWIPMFKESPKLRKLIRRPVKGDIQDRWNWMQYRNGGKFVLGFATSDDQFRGETVAITDGDEVDAEGWRVGKKGSQGAKFKLMWERSRTFWDRKQKLWSSPLDEETSNIWKRWLESDQRHYMVRCPHCDGIQNLKFGGRGTDFGIKWSVDEDGYVTDAWYVCEHNGCVIAETEKFAMDEEAGEKEAEAKGLGLQPTKTAKRPGLRGAHIPGYISLFAGAGWKQLAQEWLDAQGKPEDLQTFVNNVLGEPWKALELGPTIDVGSFAHRRPVPFEGVVPSWVRYLTAYIDVQEGWADETLKLPARFEIQVVGWAPGYEAAMIGHFVLMDHAIFSPESLMQLDDIVFRKWIRAGDGKELQIVIAGIDASHRQSEVMAVCRSLRRLQVFRPMKGLSEVGKEKAPIIVSPPKITDSRNVLTPVGTRRAKDFADRLLKQETPGPGHLHIPSSIALAVDTGDGRPNFFDSLFAERAVIEGGIERWKRRTKMNTGEVWDCLVGNIAAMEVAILTYPKRVGRELGDMSPQPARVGYDGEDKSIMAEILSIQQLKAFEGDETLSILPPGVAGKSSGIVPEGRTPGAISATVTTPPRRRELTISYGRL